MPRSSRRGGACAVHRLMLMRPFHARRCGARLRFVAVVATPARSARPPRGRDHRRAACRRGRAAADRADQARDALAAMPSSRRAALELGALRRRADQAEIGEVAALRGRRCDNVKSSAWLWVMHEDRRCRRCPRDRGQRPVGGGGRRRPAARSRELVGRGRRSIAGARQGARAWPGPGRHGRRRTGDDGRRQLRSASAASSAWRARASCAASGRRLQSASDLAAAALARRPGPSGMSSCA